MTLLKQLIHINDTIRTLSSDTKCTKNRLRHTKSQPVRLTASFSASSTKQCSKWRAPLVRQRSVPRHCDVVPEENDDSCSSSDGEWFDNFIDKLVYSLFLERLQIHVTYLMFFENTVDCNGKSNFSTRFELKLLDFKQKFQRQNLNFVRGPLDMILGRNLLISFVRRDRRSHFSQALIESNFTPCNLFDM